jgi:hypothetical protein
VTTYPCGRAATPRTSFSCPINSPERANFVAVMLSLSDNIWAGFNCVKRAGKGLIGLADQCELDALSNNIYSQEHAKAKRVSTCLPQDLPFGGVLVHGQMKRGVLCDTHPSKMHLCVGQDCLAGTYRRGRGSLASDEWCAPNSNHPASIGVGLSFLRCGGASPTAVA